MVITSVAQKKILYVDDLGDDCELFSFALTLAGYQVNTTQSFAEALQLIEDEVFDLCLFNIYLWDEVNFELLGSVRVIDPSIKIIICSSDIRKSTRQQAMQAGTQAFLVKPINLDLLTETIAQFI